ncbi:MAG: hypothetical protein R2792_14775 [Saprospiraceae bacterium]
MNLSDYLKDSDKPLAVEHILKELGQASLIRMQEGAELAKHQSKTNALLILLEGEVVYKEAERSIVLANVHDFVNIPELVLHELHAEKNALLLLVK